MSGLKRLTIYEARRQIQAMMPSTTLPGSRGFSHEKEIRGKALQQCMDILARVEQPSEEDRAVLWLIREHGWVITMHIGHWTTDLEYGPTVNSINPAEEARKLGWGG